MSHHPLLQSYTHLTTHIVPGPRTLSYFLPPLLFLPLALLIPPHLLPKTVSASLFLPLIWGCLIHTWWVAGGWDVISVNVAVWAFVLLVGWDGDGDGEGDVRVVFRRMRIQRRGRGGGEGKGGAGRRGGGVLGSRGGSAKNDKKNDDGKGEGEAENEVIVGNHKEYYWEEEPYPSTLSQRIPWVLTLLLSLRLSNWKTGLPSHDLHQPLRPMTRTAFTRYAILLALQSYLILDTTAYLTHRDPYFDPQPQPASATKITHIDSPWPIIPHSNPLLAILALLPPRLIRSGIIAAQAYALITQGGSLPCIPVVLLNALGLWPDEWSPHTWPPFFGPFAAVYQGGLRGLWGGWWHQTNRYFSVPGRWLAGRLERTGMGRKLGCFGRGGMGRYALMCVSGFGFSGIMHMGMIPPVPLNMAGTGAGEMRLWIGGFFWVQVLGIGVETFVEKVVGRGWWRGRGGDVGRFLWVVGWGVCTVPMLAMPFRELEYWRYSPLPVSLIGYLGGHGWWTWG